MSLRKLQSVFQSNIIKSRLDPSLCSKLEDPIKDSKEIRFGIYLNNVLQGLTSAIEKMYPVCCKLLGEKFFKAMVCVYVKQEHSQNISLNHYGHNFFVFVQKFKPLQNFKYLSDLLRLEWAVHQAYIGKDNMEFNFNLLAKVPLVNHSQIIFKLVENGTLIYSEFPIDKIWESNQPGYKGEKNIYLTKIKIFLWVWRKDGEIRIDKLDKFTWQLLNLIQKGNSLGQIQNNFLMLNQEKKMIELLPILVRKGYIESFRY